MFLAFSEATRCRLLSLTVGQIAGFHQRSRIPPNSRNLRNCVSEDSKHTADKVRLLDRYNLCINDACDTGRTCVIKTDVLITHL